MTLSATLRLAATHTAAYLSLEEAERLLTRKLDEIKSKDKGDSDSRYYLLRFGSFGILKNLFGHYFTAALQTFNLPPATRKKAEIAARMGTKTFRAPKILPSNFTGHDQDVKEKFEAEMKDMETLLLLKAICEKQGKLSESDGGKTEVGPFTLVNTGGFPPEEVKRISSLVAKGTSLIKAAGFGRVCYGEINLTNQIVKNSKWAAHYSQSTDEIFLRGDKYQSQALWSFIHEIGHRFDHKVVRDDDKIKALYQTIEGQDKTIPEPGTTMSYKGQELKVTGMDGNKVVLDFVSDPGLKASVPLEAFWTLVDPSNPNFGGFITPYAKSSFRENFAEMFASYCMGKLPARQKDLFEALVK